MSVAKKNQSTSKEPGSENIETTETPNQPEIELPGQEEPADEEQTPGEQDAASVNETLCALEEEKEEYKNALIRERADFENYKKRNAALSAESYKNGAFDAVLSILPTLDNFERALMADCADKVFCDGMAMIKRQLTEALAALGVEEINTDGEFDPALHNAVMQVEEEGFEPNAVVETMQKGYRMKDKILRHAMVKVNK
ncbi:MAG TPA: nucleotide exchange factor GrpE [Clostridiales bacterium]|nr:nucleotide exchange factor GrpE [Clostridiales bacterium]